MLVFLDFSGFFTIFSLAAADSNESAQKARLPGGLSTYYIIVSSSLKRNPQRP